MIKIIAIMVVAVDLSNGVDHMSKCFECGDRPFTVVGSDLWTWLAIKLKAATEETTSNLQYFCCFSKKKSNV